MGEDVEAVYEVRRQARGAPPPAARRRWKRWLLMIGGGLFCLAALIAGILLWRSFVYVRTVRGEVYPRLVEISPDVDGRLLRLHVHNDDHVQAGDLLAELDDSGLRAALDAAETARAIKASQHEQAKVNSRLATARVEGAIDGATAQVQVSAARARGAQAALDLRKAQVSQEIKGAEARAAEARAALEQLRKGAREQDIEAARVRLASATALAELYDQEVKQSEELVEEGIDSLHMLQIKKTQLIRQQNEVRTVELALERLLSGPTDEEIEMAQQVLAGREAGLALARSGETECRTLEAALEIAQAELRLAETSVARAQARRDEIALAEEQVKAAQAELRQAEAQVSGLLDSARIISRVNGIVLRTFQKVGEMCRRGVTTIKIIDTSEGLYISAFVRQKDAWRVQRGQSARVEIQVGSGNYCDAKVEEVGLSTASIYDGSSVPGATGQYSAGDPVWVKLRPVQLEHDARPGYSARAVIRVR